jgi:2-haloalkanoic acid dehalogenase type II
VLLDLDETLIDGSGLLSSTIAVSTNFAARHPELGLDPMVLVRRNGEAWERTWQESEAAWVRGELDDLSLTASSWARALESLGVPDAAALAEEAAREHIVALAEANQPYDDAIPTLEQLAASGIALAIVTNGSSAAQRSKIAQLGTDRFAGIIVTGEHGVAKPDPRIFEIALDALGVAPHEAVHVGDNLETDVGGAASAGIATVWLNRGEIERPVDAVEPTAEISSLAQLPALLGLG